MSVAIYYSSIQPAPGREGHIYGLNIAISDWLRAYFTYSRLETFTFLIGHAQELDEVHAMATQIGLDKARLEILDKRYPESNFAQVTTLFNPDPNTRHLLWQRQVAPTFAFCGLAHAISGAEAGEVLREYCLAPSESTDAIICPSRAVAAAIRHFWESYGDYLGRRFGAPYTCPVQLPVIPLGIDIEKFERRTTVDKRAAQRAALGLDENDIVVLWVGRLSAAIKAHPLAMFQAAERAAQKTGARVHLVMVGYFVPEEAETQFKNLAAAVCTTATVTFIDAHDPRFPDGLWAAGDIFLSLIDNVQESFGLTPIEAMAAGLPRVLSDWDGYRDSVQDGEDGFLIETIQPPAGHGFDFTARVASGRDQYGTFLAKLALTVAIDAEQAGDRLALLIENPSLRASMAAKAKARVKANYNWKFLIPAYEDLWADLAARRAANPPPQTAYASVLPTLPDPYVMYATYPTAAWQEDDRLELALPLAAVKNLWQHDLNTFAHDMLLPVDAIVAVIGALGKAGVLSIGEIISQFQLVDRSALWRTLGWLAKLGVVRKNKSGAVGLKA